MEKVVDILKNVPRKKYNLHKKCDGKYIAFTDAINYFLHRIKHEDLKSFFKKRWDNYLRNKLNRCTKKIRHRCYYCTHFRRSDLTFRWMININRFFQCVNLLLKRKLTSEIPHVGKTYTNGIKDVTLFDVNLFSNFIIQNS